MSTRTRKRSAPADDDEVTEITELHAEKVAGVGQPANGMPFLVLKSQLDGQSDWIDAIKSDSQEADNVLELVSGEQQDGEGEQPRHPETGQFVTQEDAEDLAQTEKAYAKATDPTERERLGDRVTLGRLKNLYNGGADTAQRGNTMSATKSIEAANLPVLIGRLEKAVEDPDLPAGTRADALQVINHYKLTGFFTAKKAVEAEITGRAQDEHAASIAAIRAAQEQASTPGNTISDPRAQVQSINDGTAQSLSLGKPAGANLGNFSGPMIGRVEPDPVTTHAELQDEYAKATNPFEKERLGDALTRQRLEMMHRGFKFIKVSNNNGDCVPVPTDQRDANDIQSVGGLVDPQFVNKSKGEKKKARKARDQRIKDAVAKALA
jgi:hypothetical protein